MDLAFTKTRFGTLEGAAHDGTRLFTIEPSTARGDANMSIKTSLPGLRPSYVVEAPEGASKWGSETSEKAMRIAAKRLERWTAQTLGVSLTVNVVDNT